LEGAPDIDPSFLCQLVTGKDMFVCNCFVDDSDILGACETEEELDEAEEAPETEGSILTTPSHSIGDARCPESLHGVLRDMHNLRNEDPLGQDS
jgi:hypothetical protein